MAPGRRMTSGHHMPDAGIFVRPCAESRGWVIRCLRTRELVVSRNVFVVKDPNSRHAQLALSDDLVGLHGALGTPPDPYRASVRALFAAQPLEPQSAPLIAEDSLTGVPIALVPARDADGDRVLVPESAWVSTDARQDPALAPGPAALTGNLDCSIYCIVPPAMRSPTSVALDARVPNFDVFTPARGVCYVNAVPIGEVSSPPWLCSLLNVPPGSPLPREIRLELRCPGDAPFYVHNYVRPCGLRAQIGMIHVRDPDVSALTAAYALTGLVRAYREVFIAFGSSARSALLLKPLGSHRLPVHQATLLSMAAIQLAAGCLRATCHRYLAARPLGMLVNMASALDAFRADEYARRGASTRVEDAAPPEGGIGRGPAVARNRGGDPAVGSGGTCGGSGNGGSRRRVLGRAGSGPNAAPAPPLDDQGERKAPAAGQEREAGAAEPCGGAIGPLSPPRTALPELALRRSGGTQGTRGGPGAGGGCGRTIGPPDPPRAAPPENEGIRRQQGDGSARRQGEGGGGTRWHPGALTTQCATVCKANAGAYCAPRRSRRARRLGAKEVEGAHALRRFRRVR